MHYLRYCTAGGLLADLVTALTIQHLTGEKLRRLEVPVVPMDQQASIIQRLDDITSLRTAAEVVRESLQVFRSALMTELLSGERLIPESYDELLSA
jgi:hypothetical protein